MAALQETGRGLTLEMGETCRGQWWASRGVGRYHTRFVKGLGGDERGGGQPGLFSIFYIKFTVQTQGHTGGNSTGKVTEERSVTEGAAVKKVGGGRKGLFTQISLMHLKYVVPQYLPFTSA